MPETDPLPVDGGALFGELDPQTIRRLDLLGPFGMGHRRPRFCTSGVRTLGNPLTDVRGQDLRLRVTADGQIMPARIVRGGVRFEEVRADKGPWTIVYSPRLSKHSEDGPVQLEVYAMVRDDSEQQAARNHQ